MTKIVNYATSRTRRKRRLHLLCEMDKQEEKNNAKMEEVLNKVYATPKSINELTPGTWQRADIEETPGQRSIELVYWWTHFEVLVGEGTLKVASASSTREKSAMSQSVISECDSNEGDRGTPKEMTEE